VDALAGAGSERLLAEAEKAEAARKTSTVRQVLWRHCQKPQKTGAKMVAKSAVEANAVVTDIDAARTTGGSYGHSACFN